MTAAPDLEMRSMRSQAMNARSRAGDMRRGTAGYSRAIGGWLMHAPQTLRALVRADEIWLVVLACLVGIGSGLLVVAINQISLAMHRVLFDLHNGGRLSGLDRIDPARVVFVPALGGLAVGLFGLAIARMRPRRPVDPIEANALYGGQVSVKDSLIVVAQTLMSNGVGASLGLEAGYTQISAAFGSRIGRFFRVRRADLRILVGCGAAGAIASAFDAPLTGAFYAFELVIGTYTLANLSPVVAAAIVSVLVSRLSGGDVAPTLDLALPSRIAPSDYLAIAVLGMACAFIGIAVMRAVTITESIFRRSRVPAWMRPGLGGLVVGTLALATPAVLSSGHAAMELGLAGHWSMGMLATLLVLKSLASAISIGSGFRGGLFFASLFLGVLAGSLFGDALTLWSTHHTLPTVVCALVGMSALAVAVIGGPLTMIFLTLETTASLPLTIAVLIASVVSALTVRRTFGYSFATWRFHLRGEAIRSAVDIGWVRSLSVGRMMRREIRTVRDDTPLTQVRRDFPLGSSPRIVAVDAAGCYAGIASVPEIHASTDERGRLSDAVTLCDRVLLPQHSVKEAIASFESAEADALVVVDSDETRRVIGMLTEQFALKRYSEELEQARRAVSGE